jgi:hypothetical protein
MTLPLLKNRILMSGKRKPRLDSAPPTPFTGRSKLVGECIKCGKSFDIVDRKVCVRKDRIQRTNFCVTCWKKEGGKNNKRRRQRWNSFKLLFVKRCGGCSECGILDLNHPSIYCFHHVDSSAKEGHLSTIAGAGFNLSNKKMFVTEARKCVVLCRNCHAIVHEREV